MSEANEPLIDREEREVLPVIEACSHGIDRDKYCYQCYLDRAMSENREDYV